MDQEVNIRLAVFNWLTEQAMIHGDVLPRELLREGLEFQGEQVPLISPQGIFKPRIMDLPLTITTSPQFALRRRLQFQRLPPIPLSGHGSTSS